LRGQVPDCAVQVPATLQEALEILAREPGRWRPLAGGTDLMVPFAAGRLADTRFLSLQRLDALRGIETDAEGITFGALVTYTGLRQHPYVRQHLPNLVQSARVTGAVAIQNRGTLGGNLVNGSPAADTPPSLLAYAAQLELTGLGGTRWVPVDAFHTGYKQNAMASDELLHSIHLPRRFARHRQYLRKVGTRRAMAISKVELAAVALVEGGGVSEVRVAAASLAPFPARLYQVEAALLGQSIDARTIQSARAALLKEAKPIDDIRSTAEYRRQVAANLLEEFLNELRLEGASI